MPTPFIMPKMDMDQETVIINEWLKKEGEQVKKGEPVVLVETDKITSEVEAPETGILSGILYGENEEVPVTQVIAYILTEGESKSDLPQKTEPESETGVKHEESTLTTEKDTTEQDAIKATPIARKMAESAGLDLTKIKTSGDKITKEDVQATLDAAQTVQPRVEIPATPAARRIAAESNIELSSVAGSGPRGRVQADDVRAQVTQAGVKAAASEVYRQPEPLSSMRKRIAERLTESYQTTPHIFLTVEVDMSQAEASRKRMNELAAQDGSPDISLTAYLVRVVAWALKRHPELNASFTEDGIMTSEAINVGVATALENGLIVPVIHAADQLSAREINECLRNLTRRAREGSLDRKEIQDGTFTISNLGMYGIQSFTAIINPPQSAILAVGTLTRRPVVIDTADTVAVRPMMMLTLGADHRIVDGVVAAAFLSDLVRALETPELLLF